MSSFCTAKATQIFSAKKFQHIWVSLDVNFNESLTNDVVSFEQLGPGLSGFDTVQQVIRRLQVRPLLGKQHSVMEIDHKILSMVILSLLLIKEGQVSVSGERICTILVNYLED